MTFLVVTAGEVPLAGRARSAVRHPAAPGTGLGTRNYLVENAGHAKVEESVSIHEYVAGGTRSPQFWSLSKQMAYYLLKNYLLLKGRAQG